MRIENYLGFPTGVTGGELTDRAVIQANKFGARFSVPARVTGLAFDGKFPVLSLDEGDPIVAKCLLIATGADYRRLPVDGCAQFEGCGVYYAATYNEAKSCSGTDVVVVGGGNSAGQAAVFLASHARRVYLVVRRGSLYDGMSSYLAKRIEDTPKIEVHLNSSITHMRGNGFLAEADIRHARTGEQFTIQTEGVFSFIGATPRTEWLQGEIETDENGFVLTGPAIRASSTSRAPFHLETSRRGVFAAGDVRAGSIKRVASAVGEGSMAIQFVHEYLKEV
jgi:thioredoxin reductase (NADPH)